MKVVWSRLAIRHLVHLREYIERDSQQNAALVAGASRILKVVDLLQTYPYVIPYRARRERLELDCGFSRPPKVARQVVVALRIRWFARCSSTADCRPPHYSRTSGKWELDHVYFTEV